MGAKFVLIDGQSICVSVCVQTIAALKAQQNITSISTPIITRHNLSFVYLSTALEVCALLRFITALV